MWAQHHEPSETILNVFAIKFSIGCIYNKDYIGYIYLNQDT